MTGARPAGWYALLAATAAIGVSNSAVFAVLSDLQDEYGFADWGLGLIAGVGMVVAFVGQLLLAPLADRGHSKALLMAGLAMAVAGSLLFAGMSSLIGFIIARGVVGLSNGLFLPAARAIAASVSDDGVAERLGRLGGIELAGFVTGPMIGALLVEPLGVRWPFIICGMAAAAAGVALIGRDLPQPPIDLHHQPLAFKLLRRRNMVVGVLVSAALFFPVGVYDAILDRYLTDRGASNWMVGASYLIYGIPFAVLAAPGGRLADRRGPLRLSLITIAICAPLTFLYGIITVPVVIMLLFAFEGAAQAIGVPSSQAVVAHAAPVGRAAAAQGLAGAVNLLGAAIGAFTAPLVYQQFGAVVLFGATAGVLVMCGGLAVVLHRKPVAAPSASPVPTS